MNKSVCILRSNPVRPDSRVEKEAISLMKEGYKVNIFAWDRDSDYKPRKEELVIGETKIPIVRTGIKASFGEGFKNIIAFLKFQLSMRKFLRRNKFDIIHACDFDTAFFSYKLVLRKKEKFVFDIFDFVHSRPKNFFQKQVKKAQYDIIKKADATIICTEDRKNQIEGSEPKKLIVVHNTPSGNHVMENECESVNISGRIKVAYVGILQGSRLLEEIGLFFSKNHDVEFHIGGFGLLEEYFQELADNNDNIFFHGRLSYQETLNLEKDCDIMLAIYDPKRSNHIYAAPNKFYESLYLGKPLLMVKGTGMSTVLAEENIGELIDYSYDGFEKGLRDLIDRKNEWSEISEKMKSLYTEKFSWEIMEKRLLDLYNNLSKV
ncbi:MAG: glycosyltransferase family 4 protein [Ruminococcaceae bacterium]|nr:glycosyltransferase family 4 protein [Oscillospiraceae bacterium]